mmetsp:Transcript_26714/g.61500  ORF Transcript_26714/g.61500 Transcript_26714/m.61500 type:complete len:441 (-) Transcript_26714:73-1395(-)
MKRAECVFLWTLLSLAWRGASAAVPALPDIPTFVEVEDTVPSTIYDKISDPCFYIIFIIDDILELGDLASGAYYTYDAYQTGFRPESLHPGCEEDDFALTPINESECNDVVAALPLPQCGTSDVQSGGGYCSLGRAGATACEADGDFEMSWQLCGLNELAIYKAVPQDCQLYFTSPCARSKQLLCVASAIAMLLSIGCSTCFHFVFMEESYSQRKHEQSRCQLAVLLLGCMCFVAWFLLANGEQKGSLMPVALCIAAVYAAGILVVFYHIWTTSDATDHKKWIFKSSAMQLPGISVLAALMLEGKVAKELHEKRKFFKLWMRIGQDVPDLIIAAIDMAMFDFSTANLLDLTVSIVEVLLYLLPFIIIVVCLVARALWQVLCLTIRALWRQLVRMANCAFQGVVCLCHAAIYCVKASWRILTRVPGQASRGIQALYSNLNK